MKTCNVCGAMVDENVNVCPYCGSTVAVSKPKEEPQPKPTNNTSDYSTVIEEAKKSVVKVIAIISRDLASYGSGCVLDNGLICTNAHVVVSPEGAVCSDVRIQFLPEISEMLYPVEVVAFSAADDVAILMPTTKLPVKSGMPLGDSDDVKMGEKVFTIGNPENQDFSYNEGVVSNPARVHSDKQDPVIQTNIELNHGNSGGPLINFDGKVMGMATYSLVEQLQTNVQNVTSYSSLRGMGFCVSSNTIKRIMKKVK